MKVDKIQIQTQVIVETRATDVPRVCVLGFL